MSHPNQPFLRQEGNTITGCVHIKPKVPGSHVSDTESHALAKKMGLDPAQVKVTRVKRHNRWLPPTADAPLESYRLDIELKEHND